MKFKLIRKIAQIMKAADLEEVEVRRFFGLYRVKIIRASANLEKPIAGATTESELIRINSPSVGTFHLLDPREPEAKLTVSLNQKVKAGQTLGLIEALGHLKPLKSEVAGTVIEIMIQNKQPVEYGQPLFRIKPS